MGEAIRTRVERLEGVDLSPAMIAKARERGIFDALEAADAFEYLMRSRLAAFDCIVAADTLCYFGDLKPILAASGRALIEGGLFAFTLETFEGDGFQLRATMRFAHSPGNLESAGAEAYLHPLLVRTASTRREAGIEVPGFGLRISESGELEDCAIGSTKVVRLKRTCGKLL
jgi:predicted TPR repeat methyltransferase